MYFGGEHFAFPTFKVTSLGPMLLLLLLSLFSHVRLSATP